MVFRRLLTVRGCNRIISSGYCDGGKANSTSDGKKVASQDGPSDSSQAKEHSQVESKAFSTTITETQTTSSEAFQQLGDEKLSGSSGSGDSATPGEAKSNIEKKQTEGSEIEKDTENKSGAEPGGFFAAYKKHEKFREKQIKDESSPKSTETFASLLRKSPFIDLGDPTGKVVVGEVYLVVENDLYIDFGWKFHCVCTKPRRNPELYVAGAKVLLRIKDLELHARFLGEKSYVSLLEADCDLIGIAFGKERKEKKESSAG